MLGAAGRGGDYRHGDPNVCAATINLMTSMLDIDMVHTQDASAGYALSNFVRFGAY